MTAWLVRRVAAAIAIVWAVVTVTFVLLHLAPGTPFLPPAETPVDPAVLKRLRSQFGLDRPLGEQYVRYLRETARGNSRRSESPRASHARKRAASRSSPSASATARQRS